MRNNGIPFSYTKAYGVQSEISHVTVTRVAGQEVDFHRNVNSYHRDMMFKINSLCREQKRLKEYRRKLLKRKWKSSEVIKEMEAGVSKTNDDNQSKRNKESVEEVEEEEELKSSEKQAGKETMEVADLNSEDHSNQTEPVLKAPDDEEKLSVKNLVSENQEKLQTKIEPNKRNENANGEEFAITESERKRRDSNYIPKLHLDFHKNELVSNSHSRASCELSLEFSARGSEKLSSTHRVIPSMPSQQDCGSSSDETTERKTVLSHVKTSKGTGLKSESKRSYRDTISTNLIKLQCTSNYKLLCRLVDAMAVRKNEKDVLGDEEKRSDAALKHSKPGSDQERFKEQDVENQNLNVDSLPCLCKTGVDGQKAAVVAGCPRHSPRTRLQSTYDAHHVTRQDMTGRRVLPPISEKKATNSVRHNINRYLRSVSPVDPLLKRLSHFEKINKVTWESAFSSLKSLKCL